MKKMQNFVFIMLLLAAMSANSFAGDNADFKFIGFSEDGKFLAFEESGEWDGAGGEYATTFFVNAAKNSFAAAPAVYEWGSDGEKESLRSPRLAKYKTSVAANLKKFGIVRGNLGKLVAAHLPGDHSFDKLTLGNSNDNEKTVLSKMVFTTVEYPVNPADEKYYELSLNYTSSKLKCDSDSTAEGIELTIKPDINHGDFPIKILQKDESIPAIRQCPSAYAIEQVWFYNGKIAVFLNYHKRGFEGDDRRYMVVTGEVQ